MPLPRRLVSLAAAAVLAAPLSGAGAPAQATPSPSSPSSPRASGVVPGQALTDDLLVIGHRGASAYRPEHTLAGYDLAARMGADYIEPDLVSTKDHVLVDRHEPEISATTDVAAHPEFADRRTTKVIDGVTYTGWFTEDFTLAELRTLRVVERLPDLRQENTLYDGRYQVPTFDEVLALRARLSRELHRTIGVIPETKHPTYFDGLGLSLEEPLVAALHQAHLDRRTSPVIVQSFETGNLRELHDEGVRVALVQLLSATGAPADLVAAGDPRTYADLTTPAGLAGIARYADAIGPDKAQVIPLQADGTLGSPTPLVDDAHRAGLLVTPYTFRPENEFLPADFDRGTDPADYGRALDELVAFWEVGVDGVFTDAPDIGVESRRLFEEAEAGDAAA